ncbi:MAG: LytR/AlgR family response regulator transcription factor [Bacillota bacterium]
MEVIIVDDEKYIRQEILYYLEMYDDIEVCAQASSGKDVLPMVKKYKPDAIFLDINLQRYSGLIIARKLLKLNNPPMIIFVTALNEHAVEGFDIGATDYIVKPIIEERFKKSIKRIRNKISNKSDKFKKEYLRNDLKKIVVKKQDKIYLLDIEEIIYLEYKNKKIKVFTKNNVYYHNNSLKKFVKENPNNFIRIHKSFIVNCNFIKEIIPWFNYRYKLKLDYLEDIEIPVSRTYISEFKETLNL